MLAVSIEAFTPSRMSDSADMIDLSPSDYSASLDSDSTRFGIAPSETKNEIRKR